MATNTRTPAPAPAVDPAPVESTPTDPPYVGPPLPPGQNPVPVTLSHHLAIDRVDYLPGTRVLVSPEYAQRLRGNGYAAREKR